MYVRTVHESARNVPQHAVTSACGLHTNARKPLPYVRSAHSSLGVIVFLVIRRLCGFEHHRLIQDDSRRCVDSQGIVTLHDIHLSGPDSEVLQGF